MTPRRPWLALALVGAVAITACDRQATTEPLEEVEVAPDADGASLPAPTSLDRLGDHVPYLSPFAVGDLANTVPLPVPGVDVGVAFDGTRLYYSNSTNNLHSFEPGDPLGTIVTVPVMEGAVGVNLDAMAYDGTRDVIWAVQNVTNRIFQVDKTTGAATFQFDASGFCVRCVGSFKDGLAFDAGDPADPSDDALWFSYDVDTEVYKLSLAGAIIEQFTVDPAVQLSSGIAIGGQNLYLANNGLDGIFRVDRDTKVLVDQFAAPGFRPEDMECDPVSQAVEVMWVRQFEDPDELFAFEIEPGTCGLGGEPPGPGVTDISIDIKPGSFPNSINLQNGPSLIPVAILTTDDFDAATVDPATVTLGDETDPDTPVATRNNGTLMASLEDVDDDGDLDLILHFDRDALKANGDLHGATTELVLLGETFDGDAVRGTDSVRITPNSG